MQLLSTCEDVPDPDAPIPLDALAPLVDQVLMGYRCADLLLRLPGAIPLPSFAIAPELPSPDWVDRSFKPFVVEHLYSPTSSYTLHPPIPFPSPFPPKSIPRSVHAAPLVVRSPNRDIYTLVGRSRLLTSIGVPLELHDPVSTKILIVSFGGQVFHRPRSRDTSRSVTPVQGRSPPSTSRSPSGTFKSYHMASLSDGRILNPQTVVKDVPDALQTNADGIRLLRLSESLNSVQPEHRGRPEQCIRAERPLLLRGQSQLRIDGAPPVLVPSGSTSPPFPSVPTFASSIIPPTPRPQDSFGFESAGPNWVSQESQTPDEPSLLPDDTWIAVVCGVSKEWGREDGEELPQKLFVAPRDVYMPDLTAVADVLLGKLVKPFYLTRKRSY